MDEMEYMVVDCLGTPNVVKALEKFTAESPQWYLHSCVPAGLDTREHPLQPGKAVTTMMYIVIFKRPHIPKGLVRA